MTKAGKRLIGAAHEAVGIARGGRTVTRLNVIIDPETPDGEYLAACARIRNISLTAFVHRLLRAIAEDQLVTSVLDDAATRERYKGEHPYRRPKAAR